MLEFFGKMIVGDYCRKVNENNLNFINRRRYIMKKKIIYGIEIIVAYFIVALLVFILRKVGFVKNNISEWIIAAASIGGALIGVCIVNVYKTIRKSVKK
jgi:hypothetical protein